MNRLSLILMAGVATLGFASAAHAADLIVETPVVSPGIVHASGNWDGAFIGVFGGYGFGTADHTGPDLTSSPFGPDGADVDVDGWLLGVTAGVNFTLTQGIVLGVVGDLAWSDIGGDATYGTGFFTGSYFTYDINWQGSVRGRIGFDGGSFLPYLTAGVAFANATHTNNLFGGAEDTVTHVGWTVGAGVEVAVADNVSLDLQYRYTDYGTETYDMGAGPGINPDIELTSHAVTAGINWRF